MTDIEKLERAVKLLPCPFCGTEPKLSPDMTHWWNVTCQNEACTIGFKCSGSRSKGKAIKLWNTRPSKSKNKFEFERIDHEDGDIAYEDQSLNPDYFICITGLCAKEIADEIERAANGE